MVSHFLQVQLCKTTFTNLFTVGSKVPQHEMKLCIYVIRIYFLTIHQLNVHRKHDIMNMKIHDI